MKLDLKTMEELAENMNSYHLESLELEMGGEKLRFKKFTSKEIKVENEIETNRKFPIEERKEIEEITGKQVVSPVAGTVYRAPAPNKAPFVEEGMTVKVGDTLCIVEAMKMMNEVKSTENGIITKILAEDGVVVKKGQVLFEIK
ncbi:acetyl-CoA carboxylase biotin carboxyl carrier protein subunit [Fusobacterium necrophorum]|uniref:Biotin carboxyl carrier protein of acetyl-CoA carboxylase n=1 Tax=Fusobacterium necrophorum subsp. funduliforme B35 TaxID=1226633 RepID=A0A017H542_9FUSO|nr:acetyl-CoA carboxylase biotin carboxyl carrier protein subunit [Fusobacterium necrophorum]EYD69278.1 acetyl-CoA carboxylase, biotin carboxyl carrier protein [Fusobacterium necrophorum subsp. funduliforme B35]KID49003.1 carboxylesterase [Fusobacterium necrophorum subsp. funduliforme B35]RXZ26011.1 acetyl-CoA carboxylase biotin carboxyl carrier protein subunit [Fusobacterium necrophorum]